MRDVFLIFNQLPDKNNNALLLMRKAISLLERNFTDVEISYFDLLKDDLTSFQIVDPSHIDKVWIVFAASSTETLPNDFISKIQELATTKMVKQLQTIPTTLILNTMYRYFSDIYSTVTTVLNKDSNFITHEADLTYEVFPLDEDVEV